MTDPDPLADRLRRDAARIGATADPSLAARCIAAVGRVDATNRPVPRRPWIRPAAAVLVAAAAGIAVLVGLAMIAPDAAAEPATTAQVEAEARLLARDVGSAVAFLAGQLPTLLE